METIPSRFDILRDALTSGTYPRNLFAGHIHDHTLNALEHQLGQRSRHLFTNERKAAVRVLELGSGDEGHRETILSDFPALDTHLTVPFTDSKSAPRRSFIFIGAGHSRAPLKITQSMFLHALTFHQVMPSFLRYVLPFGKQHYVRDFHSMGFRSASCIESPSRQHQIPQLGRSGRHIELCYSLKSVETTDDADQPWAIRQCSVHHRLDLETSQMTWIVVKANRLIRDEITAHCAREDSSSSGSNGQQAMTTTLDIHRIVSAWAGENWHWYINDLEAEVQDQTRRTLHIPMDSTTPGTQPTRSPTLVSESSPKAGTIRTLSGLSFRSIPAKLKRLGSGFTDRPQTASISLGPLQSVSETAECAVELALDDFSFDDLQCVQRLEDKVNEIHMILKANSSVINELRDEYQAVKKNPNLPRQLLTGSDEEFVRFDRYLSNVDKDLVMECARVETLLKLLSDRKNLVQGILQYRNMEATKNLAIESQRSSMKIEAMTLEMQTIAQKTKVETVSMRIITLVTLFFLPGTFISTLMSTPMVQFETTDSGFSLKNIGKGALQLYLLLSLPLVFITFLAWYLTYRMEKRRNKQEIEKQERAAESWV